ncbi:hypothetical protein AB0I60_20325 [Actinosynnema sp. NPDC050436]|uniref:hypothetical protein n=1 Tax=Actinosynnema sp. NPDC050436 TaxID=3155659 RepID=UPI0033F4161A
MTKGRSVGKIGRMQEIHRDVIAVAGAKALVWVQGRLYDVANGWQPVPPHGRTAQVKRGRYGPQFDAAVPSPGGDVVALVASTGTKGLLFGTDGELIREIDRSYYHAGTHRYPVALCTLPNGRTGLVHCPEAYNRLEVEDALTGERLTAAAGRTPVDFFHSRLAVSPSGRYLLSAGWVWQPYGCLAVLDLHRALSDPAALDTGGDADTPGWRVRAEVAGACFLGDDVVLSTSPEPNDPEGPEELPHNALARWSSTARTFTWRVRLDTTAGDLVPFAGHVLALCDHPRLFDGNTGELLAEWPDLDTGEAVSAIVGKRAFSGPARVAVDQEALRFAVTDGDRVTVVQLG